MLPCCLLRPERYPLIAWPTDHFCSPFARPAPCRHRFERDARGALWEPVLAGGHAQLPDFDLTLHMPRGETRQGMKFLRMLKMLATKDHE